MQSQRKLGAIEVRLKRPVNQQFAWEARREYASLLTPYALEKVEQQEKISHQVTLENVEGQSAQAFSSEGILNITDQSCQCTHWTSLRLPCRHVIALRRLLELNEFDESLCSSRWIRETYFSAHRLLPVSNSLKASPSTVRI